MYIHDHSFRLRDLAHLIFHQLIRWHHNHYLLLESLGNRSSHKQIQASQTSKLWSKSHNLEWARTLERQQRCSWLSFQLKDKGRVRQRGRTWNSRNFHDLQLTLCYKLIYWIVLNSKMYWKDIFKVIESLTISYQVSLTTSPVILIGSKGAYR